MDPVWPAVTMPTDSFSMTQGGQNQYVVCRVERLSCGANLWKVYFNLYISIVYFRRTMSTESKDKQADSGASVKKNKSGAKKKKQKWGSPVQKKGPDYRLVDTRRNRVNYENWILPKDKPAKEVKKEEEVGLAYTVLYCKCEYQLFEVEKKVTRITITECKNCTISVGPCTNKIEITRCKNVKLYVNGIVPIIEVSRSESTAIYLTREAALGPQTGGDNRINILSATSTATNVNIQDAPQDEEEKDWKEMPLPERFSSKFNRATDLKSMAMEHSVDI